MRLYDHRSYLRIVLEDRVVAISCLTVDPYELVELLKVNFEEIYTFPRIRAGVKSKSDLRKEKELDDNNKSKYLERFKQMNESELSEIIDNPDKYEPTAVEAAGLLLDKKSGH